MCIASAKTLRSADARGAGICGEPSTRDDKFGVVGGHKSGPPQACINVSSSILSLAQKNEAAWSNKSNK